ncbi:Rieske 2Fe-2S domain-containing protein [uncultured Sphingomonas sp.]|uniref:Rieske 2Fe-2S domain-containing protein n=1 Tax=uncultured Sphingomonas sp. TaxID=158754 RepID=UPI0035CC18E3
MYPFREGSFAVRNGWYVAAFAKDVTRKPLGRIIVNQPVALYRKEDGTAVAVGGRCPHRHYPLGASSLRGDDVVCGYHGISFGPDGRCTGIPAQTFVPGAYRIPAYPLVEHGMWLWIWPGDPDRADPALLPDLEEIGYSAPGMVAAPFYTHEVACRYQLLNDNLLDLTHLAFLHGTSIGTLADATTPQETAKRPGFISSRRYIRNAEAPASVRTLLSADGVIDRVSGMDFYLPGFHAGISDTSFPADHPEHPGKAIGIGRVFHAVTPATPGSCHYFFGMATLDGVGLEESKPYLVPVIEEDIFASVEIEKMLRLAGGRPDELMIRSDRNAVEARRMLQAMMDAEERPARGLVTQDA